MGAKSKRKKYLARLAAIKRSEDVRFSKERTKTLHVKGEATYAKAMSRVDPPLIAKIKKAMFEGDSLQSFGYAITAATARRRADAFLTTLKKKRARFLSVSYSSRLLALIGAGEWRRPVEGWNPTGRGRETQFRSLVAHLFCEYPVPRFLFQVFDLEPKVRGSREWLAFFAGVGRGMSASKLAKTHIPIPLTRKMVHGFMQTTGNDSLLNTLRWIQIMEFTDDLAWGRRLHAALIRTHPFDSMNRGTEETFLRTIIRFFARQGMLNPHDIGPYIDYISHARQEDRSWSMKGRRLASLTRDRDKWHHVLHKTKQIHGREFEPSGFQPSLWRIKRTDKRDGYYAYAIKEILSTKKLVDEGRKMKHCVYSYGLSVQSGYTSIWSLRSWPCHKESYLDSETGETRYIWVDAANWNDSEKRLLTVEVTNSTKTIVQCRGKLNRMATKNELHWVGRWAAQNGLKVCSSV